MRFKKVLCMTTLATLLFPAVQNIEYVDAAEWIDDAVYSVDIVVDTVEIDINDVPEDRCVKVGISLYNSPGINGVFFPLEKDNRLEFSDFPLDNNNGLGISVGYLANDIQNFEFYYGSIKEDLLYDGCFGYIEFVLPEDIKYDDYFSVNILKEYIYKSNEASNGIPVFLSFRMKEDVDVYKDYSPENFNITNGGIRIVGAESPQIEHSQTEPPQTEPPQTELPQTELPQTSTLSDTSTPIESTTITTTSITTTNESTVTTTENTTISTTSVTTTSSASSVTTTTIPETSEVTENKNDKNKNNLPLILAVLASVGILSGIIGFIIKKSKGHREK
ncbi:MAG: hypothetical protein IJP18_02310 [Oscillospiraceae bacterium]|nr:hypothetical protein [Oscillospiraceae bacterium]